MSTPYPRMEKSTGNNFIKTLDSGFRINYECTQTGITPGLNPYQKAEAATANLACTLGSSSDICKTKYIAYMSAIDPRLDSRFFS